MDAAIYLCWAVMDYVMIGHISARYGEKGLITLAVVVSVIEFSVVMDGVGMAVQPLLGTYLGEKNHVLIRRLMRAAAKAAVIEGLKALKEPCEVTLTSDSQYVCNAITKGWAKSWKKNNWIKSDKTQAKNSDLWEEILKLLDIHKVNIVWVKGHDGHPYNERCDKLAVEQSKKYK